MAQDGGTSTYIENPTDVVGLDGHPSARSELP